MKLSSFCATFQRFRRTSRNGHPLLNCSVAARKCWKSNSLFDSLRGRSSSERVKAEYDACKQVFDTKCTSVDEHRPELLRQVEEQLKELTLRLDLLEKRFRDANLENGALPPPIAHAEIVKFKDSITVLKSDAQSLTRAQEALEVEVTRPAAPGGA